ncbi:hypothetical protein [Clostridium butyricum]|uniref:hypothetical protein n=1 Tax=Clostridium butyricum TaxID=1492 RepID=UPI001197603E|nr:hypothetical protein [Clostridium butyricum]MBA8967632.1 hypothetical protein [Clostridium butyricum]MBA8971300.1 hypothetical protein [Clostridium butyricum]MBC2429363.1 hypothetical protein [Clostridium butyricum]NOW36833.1 hypothetical protein [Clostridium butyricum]QJU42807.1 hypothetical protein HLV60_07065 [Clostridium butyricum]
MGYSILENAIPNPYFPSDVSSPYSVGNYPYDKHPWNYARACPDGQVSGIMLMR